MVCCTNLKHRKLQYLSAFRKIYMISHSSREGGLSSTRPALKDTSRGHSKIRTFPGGFELHPPHKIQVEYIVKLCVLFLSIVHIQIHTHLKWGGYG
jgi:hypothetical protein